MFISSSTLCEGLGRYPLTDDLFVIERCLLYRLYLFFDTPGRLLESRSQ